MPKVTTKSRCCRSAKRCRTCPVVLLALEREGWAERCRRHGKGAKATYRVSKELPGKVLKAARRR